jgi:hypothetical protein
MVRFLPLVGASLVSLLGLAPELRAEDGRQPLGTLRLFSNDTIADRQDRWRSGGYGVSMVRGEGWDGQLPSRPFAVMEYRLRGEAIAPDNLNNPDPADRLYAGTWWLGAHTHFTWRGLEVTGGADLAVTGEQSGIRRLQGAIHEQLSMPRMNIGDHQVADGIYLHGTAEIARSLRWDRGELRPFLELQAGVETMARVGVDVTFGTLGEGGLRLRDPITGQRPEGVVGGGAGGWSLLLGGDVAAVEGSVFLPEDRGYRAEPWRHRLRAGVNYGFGNRNIFYGVTYLSEEFVGQSEGQVVGSLSLGFQF